MAALTCTALVFGLVLVACGDDDDDDGGGDTSAGGGGGKVALLLPESKTTRYESHDHPEFEANLKRHCPDCELIYSNANQDASAQQDQVEAALTEGIDVLVLDPVDSASAASMVNLAEQQDVPVISYDRLITDSPGVDYYVSFDNVRVGELQGQALVEKLAEDGNPTGPIVKINGSPTDNNAKLFGQGAQSQFDAASVEVAKEYDTPDWSPDEAQVEMEQAITAVSPNGFNGVYAMNDGTAGGAIAAMKGAGVDPATRPDNRSGRRAGGDPADSRRRAVHDRLQGDQPRDGGGRAAGGGARPGRGRSERPGQRRDGQRRHLGALRAGDAGRGDRSTTSRTPSSRTTGTSAGRTGPWRTSARRSTHRPARRLAWSKQRTRASSRNQEPRARGGASKLSEANEAKPKEHLLALKGVSQELRAGPGA